MPHLVNSEKLETITGIIHSCSMYNFRVPDGRTDAFAEYAAELVTGDPAVFNSGSYAAHLPQNPGAPAQSFHSAFILGGRREASGNTFKLFVIFPDSLAGQNRAHLVTPFFSGHFLASTRRTALCCLTLSAGKGLIVNFALFRLGLLFSKNCTCCSFQPSQLSNVAQANQYFCSGVRGFSGVPTHRTCMAFHNQSHCSLSLLSTHERGRGNHCLCWPIQRILS